MFKKLSRMLAILAAAVLMMTAAPAGCPAQAEETITGDTFLSQIIGTYQPLFEGATLDDVVAYVKSSINAPGYGEQATAPNFYCGFIDDVTAITFGGEDGKTVTYTMADGSSVTYTYAFVRDGAARGTYGEYEMAMDGYLYQAQEENAGVFQYLLMFPDTPATTYHLEFRYGDTEENVENLLEGPYAYWVGSAIESSALSEENEDTLQSVISLFVVENLASMTNDETAAQQKAETISTGKQLKAAVGDKYWWIIMIFYFLYQAGVMFKGGYVFNIFCNDFFPSVTVFGQTLNAEGVQSLMALIGGIPLAAGMRTPDLHLAVVVVS